MRVKDAHTSKENDGNMQQTQRGAAEGPVEKGSEETRDGNGKEDVVKEPEEMDEGLDLVEEEADQGFAVEEEQEAEKADDEKGIAVEDGMDVEEPMGQHNVVEEQGVDVDEQDYGDEMDVDAQNPNPPTAQPSDGSETLRPLTTQQKAALAKKQKKLRKNLLKEKRIQNLHGGRQGSDGTLSEVGSHDDGALQDKEPVPETSINDHAQVSFKPFSSFNAINSPDEMQSLERDLESTVFSILAKAKDDEFDKLYGMFNSH